MAVTATQCQMNLRIRQKKIKTALEFKGYGEIIRYMVKNKTRILVNIKNGAVTKRVMMTEDKTDFTPVNRAFFANMMKHKLLKLHGTQGYGMGLVTETYVVDVDAIDLAFTAASKGRICGKKGH